MTHHLAILSGHAPANIPPEKVAAVGICPAHSLFYPATHFSRERTVVYCDRQVGPDGKHVDDHPVGDFHVGHHLESGCDMQWWEAVNHPGNVSSVP